jgi:hypothetical protein
MRLARFVLLAVMAGSPGCGGDEGADLSGTWAGGMTDATGVRRLAGNCNQRGGDPTEVNCVFTVTNPDGSTGTGTLLGALFTTPGSPSGSLSYALGVVPPPCRINVSGDADVTRTSVEGTYRGANDCIEGAVRDGRFTLARP